MNTHDSNGKLNNSPEHESAHTAFDLKVCRSVIVATNKDIQNKINDILERLAMGEDPDNEEVKRVYVEAQKERIAELDRRQAKSEYSHAQQKLAILTQQANRAREQLMLAMNHLRIKLGDAEADKYILNQSHNRNE